MNDATKVDDEIKWSSGAPIRVKPHSHFADLVKKARAEAPVTVPHIIAGEKYFDGAAVRRYDPCNPSTVVSVCHDAPTSLVALAVEASRKAQRVWEAVPVAERAEIVRRGIEFVEQHSDDWAVRVALEIGKPQVHALAEASETLAFLKLYPDFAAAPGGFVNESTSSADSNAHQSVLRPYGVFSVITPFNYPICLAAGPAIAAVLAGNGVVIKTSHLGPWSGHAVYEMFEAMGLPKGLVNVIHGADEPGKALTPLVDGIAFTGSADAGFSIMRQVSGGAYPRPVIAEMGGKNPVIVTDGADIEAAAEGIAYSAFDLTGQKCSALSRVLVTPGVHDKLVALVVERAKEMSHGKPEDDAKLGPVVSKEAFERYQRVVEDAKKANFNVQGDRFAEEGKGFFVSPVVVSGLPEDHPIARDEHFLPLLTISKVASFDEALAAANAVPLGLTSGIYTGNLDEARIFLRDMQAGGVNVNVRGHATTGWWPGPDTFGGWKGSGSTGKQAFGKWYVQQFARQQSRKVPRELESLLQK